MIFACVEDWNRRFSRRDGLVLAVHEEAVVCAHQVGAKLLREYFSPTNGFIRVAACLVALRTNRFLLIDATTQGATMVTEHFQCLFLVDLIPVLFWPIEQMTEGGQWVPLHQWKGFLFEETRGEFAEYLYEIGRGAVRMALQGRSEYRLAELGTATLAVSLILKEAYGPLSE
jgi:hypothetical protein